MKIMIVIIFAFFIYIINNYFHFRIKQKNEIKFNKILNILASDESDEDKIRLIILLFRIDFSDIEIENKCKYCGCTELIGCSNGCWWINSDENICSNCGHENQEDLE